VLLPPNMPLGRVLGHPCVDFMGFQRCTIRSCTANAQTQAVCAKWLDSKPWVRVPAGQTAHVIPDCRDGGVWDDSLVVDCLRGGEWRGCNVMPRAEASGAQCLDAPSGVVWAGERLEDSL